MESARKNWKKPKQRSRYGKKAVLKRARSVRATKAKSYAGAQSVQQQPDPPTAQAKSPTPKSCNPRRKKGRFNFEFETVSADEFLLISTQAVRDLVQNVLCPSCSAQTVEVGVGDRKGIAFTFTVLCATCGHVISKVDSSPRSKSATSTRPPFKVNRKMTTAFLDMGNGHNAMARFCTTMGMKAMCVSSFCEHMNDMLKETKGILEKILMESRKAIRKAHEDLDPSLRGKRIIDITVSFDGSWFTNGFKSLFGLAAIIDILTGLVINIVILSKFYLMCALAKQEYGEDTASYRGWLKRHMESGECECSKNYSGGSGGMAAAGAVIFWNRSESEAGMRYTMMLADGDSKSLSEVNQAEPYGKGVIIEKEECVNHITKRMGAALRKEVQDSRKVGCYIGGNKKGALTESSMKLMQGYYSEAIKDNLSHLWWFS